MRYLLATIIIFTLLPLDEAEARRRRRCWRGSCNQVSVQAPRTSVNVQAGSVRVGIRSHYASPLAAAKAKAAYMARYNFKGHPGGGYGGGRAEGVGWSNISAEAALSSCSYTGELPELARYVVKRNGWFYAVKIYAIK